MQNTDRQAPLHTQSSYGAWGPSYCYSTYVTPRPMKAGKHIPKTQGKSCFPGGTNGKESACQCRRHKRRGFDPWVGKIPWRSKWQPTPVFLEPGNSMGRGAWRATVPGAAKNQTQPSRGELQRPIKGMRFRVQLRDGHLSLWKEL